jgi:hypothetical protein
MTTNMSIILDFFHHLEDFSNITFCKLDLLQRTRTLFLTEFDEKIKISPTNI